MLLEYVTAHNCAASHVKLDKQDIVIFSLGDALGVPVQCTFNEIIDLQLQYYSTAQLQLD